MEGEGDPPRRERYDTGILVPVLIGLVSVTVAVLAWRSSQLNENATDADRAALADAAFVHRSDLVASAFAVSNQTFDVQIQVLAAEARALRADAAANSSFAPQLVARAEELETELRQLRFVQFRQPSDEALATAFDREDRIEAIVAGDRERGRHDPATDIATGDELRGRSLDLATIGAVLAAAVVLLTAGQVARRRGPQVVSIALAVAIWAVSVGAAVGVGLT